jgi:hypothetical protein
LGTATCTCSLKLFCESASRLYCLLIYPGARINSIGDIQHSGATNAWEVLERTGVYMPSAASPLAPEAQARCEHASAPRVAVDGVPMLELRLLRDIPVNVISSMRIVSNVIVIRTHP